MNNAPDRIWAASVTDNYGEWQTTTDGLPRPTEYVRADLYAALEAHLAALRDACNQSRLAFAGMVSVQSAINKLDALSALSPAPEARRALEGGE